MSTVSCWTKSVLVGTSLLFLKGYQGETVENHAIEKQKRDVDCYVYPSCTGTEFYDPVTGFTNDTGFASPSSSDCCQICLPGTNPVVCFDDSDPSCLAKTGNADYDYLLFDQLWTPEFCNSLEAGFDPTLSHLDGAMCVRDAVDDSSRLTIHGLWPNYWNGYPQCCDIENGTSALMPQEVTSWDIWPLLVQKWPDKTFPETSPCGVCYMVCFDFIYSLRYNLLLQLNHEWLKHGGCYSPDDPYKYFSDALDLDTKLSEHNKALNALAGEIVTTESVKELFSKNVNVICNPNTKLAGMNESIGSFLELRSCWSVEKEMIDCPPAFSNAFSVPCPKYTYLSP